MRTWILGGLAAFLLFAVLVENIARAEDASVQSSLNMILKNQEKILSALEEVKKELQIVKVRATKK